MEGLDINHFQVFYLVADLKKFLKVAQALNISTSSVIQHIQEFEQKLGYSLIEIGEKNGLTLTEKGRLILPIVKEILDNFSKIKPLLSGGIQVPIWVVIQEGYVVNLILPYLIEFCDIYPSIHLKITTSREAPVEADIFIGSWDGEKTLFSYSLGLFASQDYVQKFGSPKTVEDLKKHRLIGFEGEPNWHLHLEETPLEPHVLVNNTLAAYLFLKKGTGIVSFSDSFLDLKKEKIVPILPHLQGPRVEINLSFSKDQKNFLKINTLCDFIENKIERMVGNEKKSVDNKKVI